MTVDEILAVSEGGGKYELSRADVERAMRDFSYHAPKGDQIERYEDLREAGLYFTLAILQSVPAGRERALAQTHLEQAIMYANAGIARGES